MINVVLYMRYSDEKQTEQSIEGQDRVCMEFCRRNEYNVINKYIDRATSASKEVTKRKEFLRMIADSEKRQFEAVVVYKLDRFARNRYDSATYKAKLKRNGVRVISATENITDSPEGIILESVLEGMAEFYSQELSQKVRRGMNESALKCNSTGGRITLGYRIDKASKKYVIDEQTAPIVRLAFDMYANGHSMQEIIERFNSLGYRTSTGAPFNKCSFGRIFANEKYIGVYQYDGVRIENGIPPIVEKETFDAVQRRLARNRHAPGAAKAKADYLLSGKLICGHCGKNMKGSHGTSKTGAKHYYYVCPSTRFGCDKKPIRKEPIEEAVIEATFNLLTPEMINEIADMAMEAIRNELKSDTTIPAIQSEIADLDRRIKNLFKLVENGAESESLALRLSDLEAQKKAAFKRLEEAKKQHIVLERAHIVWWLTRFADGDIEDRDFQHRLVDMLVQSVTVWDEPDGSTKITLLYNLTNDNNKETVSIGNGSDSSTVDALGSPNKAKSNFPFVLNGLLGFSFFRRF